MKLSGSRLREPDRLISDYWLILPCNLLYPHVSVLNLPYHRSQDSWIDTCRLIWVIYAYLTYTFVLPCFCMIPLDVTLQCVDGGVQWYGRMGRWMVIVWHTPCNRRRVRWQMYNECMEDYDTCLRCEVTLYTYPLIAVKSKGRNKANCSGEACANSWVEYREWVSLIRRQ